MHHLGAFCHAVNLENIVIPDSVKKIGKYAFTHTKLTSVTIADDCEYDEDTSFPKECTVCRRSTTQENG